MRAFVAAVLAVLVLSFAAPTRAAKDFDTEIAPILRQNCVACHSGAVAQGKLALDSWEALQRGGATGASVVPGSAADSLLYQRLITEDRTLRMPFGGQALKPELIAAIKDWIDGMEAGASPAVAEQPIEFARDIQPIFQAKCYGCHAGTKPQSQLRLDVGAAALRGGLSGKVILPGDAKNSRLIHRVKGMGGEQRMPLRQEPLSAVEVAKLERWIDAGASWPGAESSTGEEHIETHWSYVKPKRPAVPALPSGFVANNAIDHFVAARAAKEGMSQSKRAAKETLIRRVSLDLIGLPPTPAEVDAFLADERPDAYEKLVDRLLASPHYGERWARPWLDWARYADSNGFEKDLPRVMWKYRDWVIAALNANMPFDQFTVEQIAGDMLPKPTESQLIATGFHRNTMFNEEGGVDAAEAHHEVLVDRVNTTATVWLASTVGCAQCHNHKFDPFTQKEYYQLYAFFNNSEFRERHYGDTSVKWLEPSLDLPTEEQAKARKELQARIDELETRMDTETPALKEARLAWEREQVAFASRWKALPVERAESTSGTTLSVQADGSILAGGENPPSDTYLLEGSLDEQTLTGILVEAIPDASLPRGGPGRDLYGNFILSDVTLELNETGRASDWQLLPFSHAEVDDGRIGPFFRKRDANNANAAPKEKTRGEDHLWTVDASREDERSARRLLLVLPGAATVKAGTKIRITMLHASPFGKQGVGRFRVVPIRDENPDFFTEVPARRRALLAVAEADRSEAQRKQVWESFRAATPLLTETRSDLRDAQKALRDLGIVAAEVMGDKPTYERPSAPMRIRGSFLSPGETVYAAVPSVLHPLPADAMPNRLGLAKWLISTDNPLTARVMMNRFWETYFGIGIVETSEDFGSQGAAPSHPELLDWLAMEFMESGWNWKHMHKLIVMSATYQQDSTVTPALQEKDPYNRLLARGPRFRMEAEMIRDNTLAHAGLLSKKIGGPSVYPYQPDGIWDVPYSSVKWEDSEGDDRYRRGLYTFLRRSSPYPSMVTFDAPSREVCTIRRVRTNTPLQALNALNDPVFFEAARAMAARVIAEGGADTRSRAAYAFRLVTARKAPAAQLDAITTWYNQERQRLGADRAAAAKIAEGSGSTQPVELAAWTLVSNVLLNMDEAVTKE